MVIGLTGNSGSGKTQISDILRQKHGAYIIDADKVAHWVLLRGNPAYNEVLEQFGGVLDENLEIDRKKLGQIVFNDTEKRAKLVEITHKHIIAEMKRELMRERSNYAYVVLDAPLLIEAGLQSEADVIWLAYAPDEIRLARIVARDKISEEDALTRFNSQTDFEELRKYADVIIENKSSLADLELEIENGLHHKLEEA